MHESTGQPKISVVVPMYGTAAHLERCLDSIVTQTLQDLEILCVDDASPDRCGEIADAYARRDPRVRVIRHATNRGLGGARNSGILAARAPYVAGVDSDDFVRPRMMERLWEATADGFFDVVECGYEHVRPDGSVIMRHSPSNEDIENVDHSVDVFSVTRNAFWNKLWRTALFTDGGILFPENMLFEDLATTPRLLSRCRHIRKIPDDLYVYVRHPHSIMSASGGRHLVDYFRCFELLADFLDEQGLWDRHREGFLRSVDANLHWHAHLVATQGADQEQTRQYLRLLLALKLGFLANGRRLRGMTSAELVQRIRTEHP